VQIRTDLIKIEEKSKYPRSDKRVYQQLWIVIKEKIDESY